MKLKKPYYHSENKKWVFENIDILGLPKIEYYDDEDDAMNAYNNAQQNGDKSVQLMEMSSTIPLIDDNPPSDSDGEQVPAIGFKNFIASKERWNNEARDILKSVAGLYLDLGIIDKKHYLHVKLKYDQIQLSALLFSLDTMEHTLMKILEQIDMGDLSPRLLEVYTRIQDSMLNVIKIQADFLSVTEENYMNLSEEMEKSGTTSNNSNDIPDSTNGDKRFRGNKTLQTQLEEEFGDNPVNHIEDEKYDAKRRYNKEVEEMKNELDEDEVDIDEDLI